MSVRLRNQLDIFVPGEQQITIIGAGGVGSLSSYILVQMGFKNITVVDYDKVENHNIATQFYKESQLGEYKVKVLKKNIKEFTGIEIKIFNEKFKPEHTVGSDIVICAVDDMDTRKEIVDNSEPNIGFIDVRMGGQIFEMFVFHRLLKEKYFSDWYPSSEASHTVCTLKGISYNTAMIAAMIGSVVKKMINGEEYNYNYIVDMTNLLISN